MKKKAATIAAILILVTSPALAKKSVVPPSWLAKAKAECIEHVVSDYGVDPGRVTLVKNRHDAKGLLNIPGKVDKGTEGIKEFICKFNTDGALVDVMSMTSDGAL